MISVLCPIFRQLEETYEAILIAVDAAGEDGLAWKPAQSVRSFGEIAGHIASGSLAYATMIGPTNVRRTWEIDPAPTKQWLLARLEESLARAREAIEGVTEENIAISRADDWCPNCEEQRIQGPLDALWFAQQMVRHAAYHLGQLNLYLQLREAS